MNKQKCNHEWVEDEFFKEDMAKMLLGNFDSLRGEIRLVCKRCGEVDYILKKDWLGEYLER